MKSPLTSGRVRRFAVLLVLLGFGMCVLGMWAGCGTPRERYQTLSFFFDGVPDPDKPPPKVGNAKANVSLAGNQGKPAPVIVVTHKPYANGQCDACHRNANGEITGFGVAASSAVCLSCHQNKTHQYPRMHGPVALGNCSYCHAPHDSPNLHLLAAPPRELCTRCHDRDLLSNTPPEHMDGITACTDCHSGHGGPKAGFLIARPNTTQPATAPATQPNAPPAPAAPRNAGRGVL